MRVKENVERKARKNCMLILYSCREGQHSKQNRISCTRKTARRYGIKWSFLGCRVFCYRLYALEYCKSEKSPFGTIAKKPDNLRGVSAFAVRSLYDITKG
jgi:hypothetical protein